MNAPRTEEVIREARRILAWDQHGGNVRQVDSIVLRSMDANEDNAKRVHLIPIGEAIGVAITDSRSAPEDNDIVFVSSHALGAAFAALGFVVVPAAGGAIIPPRSAYPDYRPGAADFNRTVPVPPGGGRFDTLDPAYGHLYAAQTPAGAVAEALRDRLAEREAERRAAKVWAANEAVFCGVTGNTVPLETLYAWFGRSLVRAKLPHMRWHDLRASTATLLIEMGVDLETVRRVLGHRDIATTLRYVGKTPTALRGAADKLGEAMG